MKVRDLIKDTVWLPGRDHDAARPKLSVLMPTYRRGPDGFFLRAARSILDQSLRDLELIIIDDGSTDGTAQQIDMLMAADERVSCLRHPGNIGLPAVSEYEAFTRARGELFAFGFDDFIFDPDAMSGLVAAAEMSPNSAVHGYAEWFDAAGIRHFYGKDPIPHEQLVFYNFLANASFLVPRVILEDVGLYDPHIAATRLCDWDLWRRILRKYPINRIPVLVGREHGNTRDDSLGNTYPLFEESMQEYFGTDRNAALRPGCFPELDVWQMPSNPSAVLAAHILMLRAFFGSREWARGIAAEDPTERGSLTAPARAIVGIFGTLPATMTMNIAGLRGPPDHTLHYIPPELDGAQLYYSLVGCAAVIMAQRTSDARSEHVRAICAVLNIPLYDSTDGNAAFEIIASSPPVNALTWIARLRTALAQSGDRIHVLASDLAATRQELSACAQRLEHAEAQLKARLGGFSDAEQNSRAFRLALKLRMLANGLRKVLAWLRLH